jgi:hypothetical protein
VREGLRDDLKAAFLKTMANDPAPKSEGAALGAGFAALLAPKIIDNAIDAYVTPQGIANLVKMGRPQVQSVAVKGDPGGTVARPIEPSTTSPNEQKFDIRRIQYAFFAQDPLTFRIDIASPEGSKVRGDLTLLLKWSGDWKLTRVFLPMDAFK